VSIAPRITLSVCLSPLSVASCEVPNNFGAAIVAMIPMIITTITNSISENPRQIYRAWQRIGGLRAGNSGLEWSIALRKVARTRSQGAPFEPPAACRIG
jgi:hypothetical protein